MLRWTSQHAQSRGVLGSEKCLGACDNLLTEARLPCQEHLAPKLVAATCSCHGCRRKREAHAKRAQMANSQRPQAGQARQAGGEQAASQAGQARQAQLWEDANSNSY